MAPWPLGSRSRASSSASSSAAPATPIRTDVSATAGQRAHRPHLPHLNSHASSHKSSGRRPVSPTHSTRSVGTNATGMTRASRMEWGETSRGPDVIITRTDMRNSLDTYERLLSAAKAYRNAMLSLASATSNFASALEDCARQKGAASSPKPAQASRHTAVPATLFDQQQQHGQETETRSNGDGGQDSFEQDKEEEGSNTTSGEKLLAAAGLHHVMSNQQQLLSDTFYKSFEIPLLEKFDNYKNEVQDRQLTYEKDTGDKSKKIRETEAENMRMGRKKQRDLASFRRALITLQTQVDDLDRIKADYYTEVLAGEQETWDMLAGKVALVVRSQIDSADRIVTKGSADQVIEEMVGTILDPFNAYGLPPHEQQEGHIFSILPPLGINSPATSSNDNSPNHPSSGLARTRVNLSSSTVTQVNGSTAEASPASTVRWAEEQKRRASGQGAATTDSDATPKRRGRADQLSWISEGEDGAEETNKEAQSHTEPNGSDPTNMDPSLGIVANDEDEPRWA